MVWQEFHYIAAVCGDEAMTAARPRALPLTPQCEARGRVSTPVKVSGCALEFWDGTGAVGITAALDVYNGAHHVCRKTEISARSRRALALHMIALWQRFGGLTPIFVLSVALGVFVMSPIRIGNVYARNLGVAPEVKSSVVRIDPVKDWPPSRQLALMFCRKTEFVKTVTRVLERSTVKAQRHDYRFLKAQDLITHFKTERYPHGILVCTPQGAGIADTLAFHHAGELRMHLFKPSGGQWHEAGTLCSCGWRGSVPTGAHTQANIMLAQSRHLAAVENGTWKPMAETLDAVLKHAYPVGTYGL